MTFYNVKAKTQDDLSWIINGGHAKVAHSQAINWLEGCQLLLN